MDEVIELKDVGAAFENIIDPLVAILLPKQAGILSLAHVVLKAPGAVRDYDLYRKFGRFVTALRDKDLHDSVKFSSELFEDEKTARDNALRLVRYIDRAETLTVVDFMVNASRAVGNQLITLSDFFRIMWALTYTFPEDLQYFKTIATSESVLQGNTQIIALTQTGLMISAGADSNRSVEEQDYAVSSFGTMVDRYALSFDDEKRWNYWKSMEGKTEKVGFKAPTVEWESIDGSNDGTLAFKIGK